MELSAIDIGEGPPAVLLHGQPGSAGDWGPVIDRLRDRIRVIAPDRPGYGLTGGRAAGFADNAAAVVALLERLEIDSAVVAAHSWATGVALAAAIRFPVRIRALVLAAPVAPGIPPGVVDRALAHPIIGAAAAHVGFALGGFGLALPPVRRLAHRAVRELPSDQVAITAAHWRADHVWRSFHAEQRFLVADLPSLAPCLGVVDKSATILYGTRDWISPPAHAQSLAQALSRSRLVPADRAGHMLPQQRPDLVAEAIARAAA